MAKVAMVCARCGGYVYPRRVTNGSILIELVLWLCFFVPGLIYSIWRLTTRHRACPLCGSRELVPEDSPRGRELLYRARVGA